MNDFPNIMEAIPNNGSAENLQLPLINSFVFYSFICLAIMRNEYLIIRFLQQLVFYSFESKMKIYSNYKNCVSL